MACENLSNYYPIVMKFSRDLLLEEDTSTIDFGPDRLIPLAGHAPKVVQIRLLDRVKILVACSVAWGIASYQLSRRFVNPFITKSSKRV